MSKELLIDLLPLGVNLIVWGGILVMGHHHILYSRRKHKKRMKEIEEEWEERRRRWQVMDTTDEVNEELREIRRNLDNQWPFDIHTDKLSPPKKMGKHKMR